MNSTVSLVRFLCRVLLLLAVVLVPGRLCALNLGDYGPLLEDGEAQEVKRLGQDSEIAAKVEAVKAARRAQGARNLKKAQVEAARTAFCTAQIELAKAVTARFADRPALQAKLRGMERLLEEGKLVLGTGEQQMRVPGARAEFVISEQVAIKDPPRFGANLKPWPTAPWWAYEFNQFVGYGTFEPVRVMSAGYAVSGDGQSLSAPKVEGNRGLSYFGVFGDGFFEGGRMRLHRFEGGDVSDGNAVLTSRLLRESGVKRFEIEGKEPGKTQRVVFDKAGEAVQAGDYYVLDKLFPQDGSGEEPFLQGMGWELVGLEAGGDALQEGNMGWSRPGGGGVRTRLVMDPAPEPGSTASLRLQNTGETVAGMRQGLEGASFDVRLPRKELVFSLWAKVAEGTTGRLVVRLGRLGNRALELTPKWQRFEWTVDAREEVRGKIEYVTLAVDPGAVVQVDQVVLRDPAVPAFAMLPEAAAELSRLRPGLLRFWMGYHGYQLEDVLQPPAGLRLYGDGKDVKEPHMPWGIPQALAISEATGADPWFILSPSMGAEGFRALVEYLAGPVSTPYGALRAAHGREKPWTEAFAKINLESANEPWNQIFNPWAFPQRGHLYGALTRDWFETAKTAPGYSPEDFRFVTGVWTNMSGEDGFGAQVLRNNPVTDAYGLTGYFGGNDMDSVSLPGQISEFSWFNQLTLNERLTRPLMDQHEALLRTLGREDVAKVMYEGGPGYPFNDPDGKKVAEEMGKSLASAVTALDVYAELMLRGFKVISHYKFSAIDGWSSHSKQGWRPHPYTEAMVLRNQAEGDLLKVESAAVPRLDLQPLLIGGNQVRRIEGAKAVDMVRCLVFRKGDRFSVLVYSKLLHDSTDVTLRFPFAVDPSFRMQSLGGDSPALNNRETLQVVPMDRPMTGLTQTHNFQLPPHSIVLLSGRVLP